MHKLKLNGRDRNKKITALLKNSLDILNEVSNYLKYQGLILSKLLIIMPLQKVSGKLTIGKGLCSLAARASQFGWDTINYILNIKGYLSI